MKLKFTVSLTLIILLGCKGQVDNINNKKMDDQILYSFDRNEMNFLVDIYDYSYKESQGCRKNLSENLFNQKIKEIYNIDVLKSRYNDVYVNEISESSDEILINQRMVFINNYPNLESKEEITESYLKLICNYNNMIFYNEVGATNWIKSNHPYEIIKLSKEYGYTKNKDWLQFAFSKSELYRAEVLESFLFDVKCRGEWRGESGDCNTILTLRKDMLAKMIEYSAELSQLHLVANMVSNGNQEMYSENTDDLYNYLIAHCYAAGQSGIIEYVYDTNPKMKDVFRKNNYYNIEGLEEYTNELYKPTDQRYGIGSLDPDPYLGYGVINDPDGYTNLRDGKGTNTPVVKKIVKGEKFAIKSKSDDWWLVVIADGTQGWIHKSRITITEDLDK